MPLLHKKAASWRFGEFGGRYVPETTMNALIELEAGFEEAMKDPSFKEELNHWLEHYSGRPTALTYAKRLTEYAGGAKTRTINLFMAGSTTPWGRRFWPSGWEKPN